MSGVDIGTGTGLLSYFACQAGAARVYAIEEGPVVNLAREMAKLNGFDDRVEFFNDLSYRVELPERADVLITETLWNFGIGEGMIGFLADARRRFLKPEARIIPGSVDLHVAPLQADKQYALLHERPSDRHGLDLRRCATTRSTTSRCPIWIAWASSPSRPSCCASSSTRPPRRTSAPERRCR